MDGWVILKEVHYHHLSSSLCRPTNNKMYAGPYDAIHVGAAAPTVPQALIDQLASPGRMFIPVGTFMQYIEQIDKDDEGNVHRKKVMGVRVRCFSLLSRNPWLTFLLLQYVPLTDREAQVGH